MLIEMKVSGITLDPFTNAPIVILKDIDDKNALPVWIGVLEASAIATELEDVKFSRPMTHDLMKTILTSAGVTVERIEVVDIRDNVFYAEIHVRSEAGIMVLDARPSDAIAIALRMNSPIFVDTRVLDKSRNIDMRTRAGRAEDNDGGSADLEEFLDELTTDDFGKYKM